MSAGGGRGVGSLHVTLRGTLAGRPQGGARRSHPVGEAGRRPAGRGRGAAPRCQPGVRVPQPERPWLAGLPAAPCCALCGRSRLAGSG